VQVSTLDTDFKSFEYINAEAPQSSIYVAWSSQKSWLAMLTEIEQSIGWFDQQPVLLHTKCTHQCHNCSFNSTQLTAWWQVALFTHRP